jgi:hypothetical protein
MPVERRSHLTSEPMVVIASAYRLQIVALGRRSAYVLVLNIRLDFSRLTKMEGIRTS